VFAYRIADARHPIFDPTGPMLHGGRWNSIGHRVIYAAETYAGALLEVLVHSNLSQPPKNHRIVRINIPDEVAIESVAIGLINDWDAEDMVASRAFGDQLDPGEPNRSPEGPQRHYPRAREQPGPQHFPSAVLFD
jgi:RES domain-containing protein